MKPETATALKRAALRTFEELGYLLPTEAISDPQRTAALEAELSVPFSGPVKGVLFVRLYGSNARPLAANMLGSEGDVSDSLVADALGELANVITGNALPEIYGRGGFFRLGRPCVILGGQALPPGEDCVEVGLESGRAELSLSEDD